jgi:hypothetical protein
MNINDVALRNEVAQAAIAFRQTLRDQNIGLNFEVTIKVEGSIQQDDAKISFKVDYSLASGIGVTGSSMSRAIEELIRREGWKAENAPLMLSAPEV